MFLQKINGILLSFFVLSMANAATFEGLLVKINSQSCSGMGKKFNGSGMIVDISGSAFVVTSEHVVIQQNQGICHSAQNDILGKKRLKLVKADWEKGLALLKVEDPVSEIAPRKIETIISTGYASEGEDVVVAGYPAESLNALSDRRGKVVLSNSRRHLMPSLNSVIEVQGAHGEFGMSGGIALQKGQVVGLLSHQFIQMRPGQKSQISEFSGETQGQNHLIIIPGSEVLAFTKQTLKSSDNNVQSFKRNAESQLKGKESIEGYGLQIKSIGILKPNFNKSNILMRGGGDGVGIGGDDQEEAGIEIQIDQSVMNFKVAEYPALNNLLKYNGGVGKSFQITGFAKVDLEKGIVKQIAIRSLDHFMTMAKRSDLDVILNQKASLDSFSISKLQTIQVGLANLKKLDLNANSHEFIAQLEFITQLMMNGQTSLISRGLILKLANQEDSWNELFNSDFDASVELRSSLLALAEKI